MVEINNKLGHCINYSTTCEIETTQVVRQQQLPEKSSILTIIPNSDKDIVLTYLWAHNFDHIIDNQAGGGAINTTHLVAFQVKNVNCHYDSNLPTIERTKRRTIEVTVNEMAVSNIKTNVEPPLIDTKAVIEQNMECLYAAKYFAWCWLRQHNSLDQVVSSYRRWLLKECDNKNLAKIEISIYRLSSPKRLSLKLFPTICNIFKN